MGLRIVIDTNVYVSRFLRPDSVPGAAVAKAWSTGLPLISKPAWVELRQVLMRPKFAPYIKPETIEPFLHRVWAVSEVVLSASPIRACRNPRDDKFLEVAVHGRAGVILTGDSDLLDLHPYHGIAILTPQEFLDRA